MNKILARLIIPPLTRQVTSINDLLEHIGDSPVELPESIDGIIIGDETPGPEDRERLWLRIDVNGSPHGQHAGFHTYRSGKWRKVWNAKLGEQRTFMRVADTLEEDIPDGWTLADGDQEFGPDLRVWGAELAFEVTDADDEDKVHKGTADLPNPFFRGIAPDWDTYTCYFTG